MSGHSKWSTIKHKKGVQDARRGQLFTKLTREVIIAARQGGPDPEMNFRLRLAVQTAKAGNMPSDNIERAIKKGAGLDAGGEALEEVLYEGYGPGGAAILVQTLTDNRNRTVSDVRSRLTRAGGNLAETGAVAWVFENKGVIRVEVPDADPEEVALEAVDAGAEDFEIDGQDIEFTVDFAGFESLRSALEQMEGVAITSAEMAMMPNNTIPLDPPQARQNLRLLDSLEELDDVQKVFCNVDFSDDVLAEYAEAS